MKVEKPDRFGNKESYITRMTLNDPLIIYIPAKVFTITDSTGFTFDTKIEPEPDYMELFERNNITCKTDKPYRKVNARSTIISGIYLKISGKFKTLEYVSESKEGADKNYSILEKELYKQGITIKEERTKKCSKESCLLTHKGTTQTDIN